MSLSVDHLDLAQSYDPRIALNSKRKYDVLKGGLEVNGRTYTSTAFSSSNIAFSTIPPSPNHIIDPGVDIRLSIQLTFAGTGTGNLLQIGTADAPRFMPINTKLISNLVSQINNAQASINSSDFMSAFLRMQNSPKDRISYNSTSCNMPDMSQEYADLVGFIKNPLGAYGDGTSSDDPRGGFAGITVLSNTNTAAVVNLVFTERIILPPWVYGADKSAAGFTNVQTLDWNFTLNDLSNCWSHAAGGNTISSITSSFFAPPQLDMIFVSRNPLLLYPKTLIYPYTDISRYPTPVVTLAAGASFTLPSNNIQLQSIPNRLVMFAREQNSDLLGDPSATDTFMNISNVQIQWGNRNALLGAMTEQQLYQMSVKNGLDLSWTQWNKHVGSLLIIEPPTDLGLQPDQASGLLTTLQLQVNVTLNNKGPNSKNVVFYILVLQEGTLSLFEGESRSVFNLNVLQPKDVLASYSKKTEPYWKVERMVGGSFFSKLSRFFAPINEGLKKTKVISRVSGMINHPVARFVNGVSSALGYGMRRKKVVRRRKVRSGGAPRRRRMRGAGLGDEEYEDVEVDSEGNEIEGEGDEEEQEEEVARPVTRSIHSRLRA